jgi:hypothetical protein
MKRNILINQIAVGPTYKRRLLNNLLNYKSYDFFDVLILTEDVEYFSSVSDKPNLFIRDVNEIRKDYPWSLELEKIPPVIHDEDEYSKLYTENNYKFPTMLERFSWGWERAEMYDGFISMNCDVLPTATDESYEELSNYFANPVEQHPTHPTLDSLVNKIIVIPGGSTYDQQHHGHLLQFAQKINDKYKITDKPLNFHFQVTDGNFRTFKLPSRKHIRPFFELVNNIVYDILTDDEFFLLHTHTMWNIHSEYLFSIILYLFEGHAFYMTSEWGFSKSFLINCYPEDRFWSWGAGMDCSTTNRQDFVQKNYNLLKQFYEARGQVFPY